jgi:hypothetical protein
MSLSKIVCIVDKPINWRDYDRFGLSVFQANGIDVILFELGDLSSPAIKHNRDHYNEFKDIVFVTPNTHRALKQEMEKLRDVNLIIFRAGTNGVSRSNLSMARLIGQSNIPYLVINPPVVPGWEYNHFFKREGGKIGNLIKLFFAKDLLNSLIARTPPSWFNIPHAHYLLDCCPGVQRKNSLVGHQTQSIIGHAHDYDIYVQEKQKNVASKEQAVFIDQYFPYHPDQHETKLVYRLDPESYYQKLEKFFDRIEHEFNLPVVIAAHPRADYSKHKNAFSNREVHYNSTPKLILESKLVLAQTSTAISFAILAKKPLMLLNFSDFEELGIERYIFKALSELLGLNITYIDEPLTLDRDIIFKYNDQLYDNYLDTYVKKQGSPLKSLWQIVIDQLNETVAR